MADHGGDVVEIGAGTHQRDPGDPVAPSEGFHAVENFRLRKRRRQVEEAAEPVAGRDVGEKLLEGLDPHRFHQDPLILRRMGHVIHGMFLSPVRDRFCRAGGSRENDRGVRGISGPIP